MSTWDPQNTWVVAVGLLSWLHADSFSSFPTENRRDTVLLDVFRRRGVPPDQILHVADAAATTRHVERAVPDHLARAPAGSTLYLYFCGHGMMEDGGKAYFATYDADGEANKGWAMRSVISTVDEHFRGAQAVLTADCCYSGVLASEVRREKGRIAYAGLTSSAASELSTGNWTFTEQLVGAFDGRAFADKDGSGAITLRELASQVMDTMAFAEDQRAAYAFGDDFDADLVLGPACPRGHPRVGERVEAESGGKWYRAQIVDAGGDTFRVHYFGYGDDEDEWVSADQVRALKRTLYPVGKPVEVKWKTRWYAAHVLDVENGIHHISYDGFGDEWNEWVGDGRIRKREG